MSISVNGAVPPAPNVRGSSLATYRLRTCPLHIKIATLSARAVGEAEGAREREKSGTQEPDTAGAHEWRKRRKKEGNEQIYSSCRNRKSAGRKGVKLRTLCRKRMFPLALPGLSRYQNYVSTATTTIVHMGYPASRFQFQRISEFVHRLSS